MSLKIRYFEAGAATPQRLQSGNTESVDSPIWLLIGVKCTLLKLRWIRRRWRGPGEWGGGGGWAYGGGRGWKRQSPQWEQSLPRGQIQYKRTSAICARRLLPTPCQFTSVCCGSLAEVQQHNSFNNSHTLTWGRIYELVWWWNDFTLCVVKAVNKLTLILWAQSITWLASHLRLWLLGLYWTVTKAECSKVHESVRVFAHVCMFVKFPHVSNAAFHRDGF